MIKQLKGIGIEMISFILAVCLLGCEMTGPTQKNKVDVSSLKTTVSRVIDEEIDTVKDRSVMDKDPVLESAVGKAEQEVIAAKGVATVGSVTVKHTMEEETGRDYLEFCYAANFEDKDMCIEKAQSLMDEKEYDQMVENINRQESRMLYEGWQEMKKLSAENQAKFNEELRKLIVKTVVLMVAGIVYAVIPTTVFWGKVSAACAISVAAGILASSIVHIVQYYKTDTNQGVTETFDSWLNSIASEPTAYYALATSMINIGVTAGQSPVVTGLIICVFALFQVIDPVKEMLKKYGNGGTLQE